MTSINPENGSILTASRGQQLIDGLRLLSGIRLRTLMQIATFCMLAAPIFSQIKADTIPPGGNFTNAQGEVFDYSGAPKVYGDPSNSKYVMVPISTRGNALWRNGIIYFPDMNQERHTGDYRGNYDLSKSPSNGQGSDIYRITRPGSSTNLLPGRYSNEDPYRSSFKRDNEYHTTTLSFEWAGVTSGGFAVGKLLNGYERQPVTDESGNLLPQPYPDFVREEASSSTLGVQVFDTNTGKIVNPDPLGYSWSTFGGYQPETDPTTPDLRGINDSGEMIAVSKTARALPLYYKSPYADPEVLASMISTYPGQGNWALTDVAKINNEGIIYGYAQIANSLDKRHHTWYSETYKVALIPRELMSEFYFGPEPLPNPVPEPSTWLMGTCMIAAAAWKFRNGRSN
jgi:hypothetical protein